MTPLSKPEWFKEVLDEGTRMEDTIRKQWVEEFGDTVKDDQREVKLWVMENDAGQQVHIVGHIDGITDVEDGGDRVVTLWEAKKFRDSTWEKFMRSGVECNPNYPMQVSAYMHALSDEYDQDVGLFFVGGHYQPADKDAGLDEAITETYTHGYIDPPINRLAIRKHIGRLEKIIAEAEDVTAVPCCDPLQYPCGFYFLHDEKDERRVFDADEKLVTLTVRLNEQQTAAKTPQKTLKLIEAEIKRLKGEICEWLMEKNIEDADTMIHDQKYSMKTGVVERKGYEVKASSYKQTTIKKVKA